MCGIAGYMGTHLLGEEKIREALRRMKNRGPDHQAFKTFQFGGTHVALLHSRLSIIDLDARSHQPLKRGDCWLVFNGEIYNHVELRKDLQALGRTFTTASDTEVLLEAYLAWGEQCLERMEGMWAFAIYDEKKHTLFLARDRFAEKPLYWRETPTGFFFGSEVKFLKALAPEPLRVNERQVLRYLVNGYKCLYKTPETFFEEVEEVPYATWIKVSENLRPKPKHYWAPVFQQNTLSLEESVAGFRDRLFRSVEIRLRADVPLAFCLSGGVDSASLVSIAAKKFNYDVSAYSIIDKDERYDESENIRATVKDVGCRSTLIEIPRADFFERLDRLVSYHDAPVYTITYYVHSLLSEAIARDGYKVVVSGTAADELVTGYYDHFNLFLYEMRGHLSYVERREEWERHIRPLVRNPHLKNPELYMNHPGFRDHIYLNNDIFAGYLKKPFREAFVEECFTDSLLRNRMLNELFHEATPVVLHEDDLNSMGCSLENRSPFLDTELVRFAYSIPAEHLIRDGYGKYILREAMKGVLNDQVRLDRWKKGFNASVNSLLDLEDPQVRSRVLRDGRIFDLVDRGKIAGLLGKKPMPNSFSKFLFSFLSAQSFLEMN